ncbi:Uma2 family endonuclease [Kutzneria kofuensis]|uniref:Uma2 family endonuclease n=1 Tax=Kutzneria kofuensis TaxID=103725 RepID=A0A7W9KDV6_9PSEU|nr:Uma2 family endonuclease [Kutzneria kofuensis]MBB5890756.1 Uma2 family endonuclease [Kutzneria kofuensis]
MTAMDTYMPSGPLTVADLEVMPDDGRRYELIDGMLFVSPAPGLRHQKMVAQMIVRLESACPDDLHVLPAPFAVQTANDNEVQPDVLVARNEDLTEKNLPVAPLLAVEVLSPSTTLYDLNTKKAAYQRMGVQSYWVVDPLDPRLTVFELAEAGEYELVADVKGDDAYDAERPFPVRVAPADLLGRLNQSR